MNQPTEREGVIRKILVGGVAMVLLAFGVFWMAGGRMFYATHDLPPSDFVASNSPEAIARGEALTRAIGCDGCHGEGLAGEILFEERFVARVIAPGIPALATSYSDADFDRAIRHGIRPDGTGLIAMPSAALRHMTDEDLDGIVSYVRSLDRADSPELPTTRFGPLARLGMLMGDFQTAAVEAADGSEALEAIATQQSFATTEQEQRGAYLATLACSGCHGVDFGGEDGPSGLVPDLRMALAYDDAAFLRLLREGEAHDGRDLGVMGQVYERLGGLSDADLLAIRAFAEARASGMSGAAGASTP